MRASGGGAINNVSPVCGLVGASGYIAYTASKGAVTLMTKSAAAEYGPNGIRVNIIHPGAIATPMFGAELAGLPENALAGFIEATPLRRLAEPEEVSNCVLFLASDEGSFVTGAELVVDDRLIVSR
ncbi:MAG: SDR family oxidoreductase [Hyphomicrobiales bacterium]|nr:MAG: SDR family oxidoreductase [Hyphomicrobiales bacterium]